MTISAGCPRVDLNVCQLSLHCYQSHNQRASCDGRSETRSANQNIGNGVHSLLLRAIVLRTSASVTPAQIDRRRLLAKRLRATRLGGDDFLYRRALDDCLDRSSFVPGRIGKAVIVGGLVHPDELRLTPTAQSLEHLPLEALEPGCADIVIAVGLFEISEDPALTAFILHQSLKPGGRLIGSTIGSGSLTRMRRAFLDAERAGGRAVQRFHPLPDAAALSGILSGAGMKDVVIDVDGFHVRYSGLDHLIRDLRSMGCTNSLLGSVLPLRRADYEGARSQFSAGMERVEEKFEILHFSASPK